MREADDLGEVDAGWGFLDRGDLPGARAALERAQRRAPDAPEVICLEGAIFETEGDIDRALALYARATELDPEYPLPLIQAACVEFYSHDDPEAALALLERALEVADHEDDAADALVLAAEAEIALGEEGAAREAMEELEKLAVDDPRLLARAGQVYLALTDLARAEASFGEALAGEPTLADAHHGLGLVCESRGDRRGAVRHWLTTRRLDLAAPRVPWHLSAEQFEQVAEAALAELPREVLDRLENVPVLIDDVPGEEIVGEGYDPRLLGLFSGIPLPHKSHVTEQRPALDAVHLYQLNLERMSRSREELADEIRITVLHETAHFFGLEDEDLDELGLG